MRLRILDAAGQPQRVMTHAPAAMHTVTQHVASPDVPSSVLKNHHSHNVYNWIDY